MKELASNKFEQFTLRVKSGGELDRVMRAILDSDKPLLGTELNVIGGLKRSAWLVRFMAKHFDNYRAVIDGDTRYPDSYTTDISYVPVIPTIPVAVGMDVVSASTTEVPVEPSGGNGVRWPQAPPMIESMGDKFRMPSWYSTMKTMVENSRHIALSGPPGVGKDTAVHELAAREGRILVTVGGDGGFRRRDLVGNMQISGGRSFFEVAEYAAAVVNGWWVVISEVNAADPDALLFINAQLAPPNIINIAGKAYPVHKDFRLFVTYNPGLIGTKPLPQSFKDRFFPVKVPFFKADQLRRVLEAHGMPERELIELGFGRSHWQSMIVDFGMAMWDAHVRGQLRYQVTSRRLMDAVTLMNNGAENVLKALELAVVNAIDSPIESKTANTILNGVGASVH